MAKGTETLNIEYDATNDVLRVLAMPYPDEDPIAVPGATTILVSGSLDRVVGLVFTSYLANLRQGIPKAIEDLPDDALVQIGSAVLANAAPVMMRESAPMAKDAVAYWIEAVSSLDRSPSN